MMLDTKTPVLILGGKENSLSVTRHLGRLGIAVRVSGTANCLGMYSRYCRESLPVRRGTLQIDHWKHLLLGAGRRLDGHIVLAMSDEALEFLIANHSALQARYLLDVSDPQQHRDLLDKQKTLELASAAGIAAPRFWTPKTQTELAAIRGLIRFPVMVKPKSSHKFSRALGVKLFIIEDSFDELARKFQIARDLDLDVMVVEMIPGPDSLLSSYYSYIDGNGTKLFRYTKRIIRRWPVNRGNACYHANDWLPETAAAGEKLFDHIGLKGLGNVEFKRDTRDGLLKVIEVNTRITAAQELTVRSGIPIDLIIYLNLTGQPVPQYRDYRHDLRLWHPFRDFLCYLELRQRHELTFPQWLKSVATMSNILPLFSLTDPLPMFGAGYAIIRRLAQVRH